MNELLIADKIYYKVEHSGFLGLGKSEKTILNDVSFNLEKGKVLGIAGESGSGKTTLAKIIAGIIQYTSGKLIFNNHSDGENKKANPIQILFQNNGEILNPLRRIDEIVSEAIVIGTGSKKNIDEEKQHLFNSLNFPEHLWNRKGFELSGGEQQRAALARLLAVKPQLLILDEPFSAQDPESQLNLLKLFRKINTDFGITLICIAHNLRILQKLCDNILIMYKGEIVEQQTAAKIFTSPKHPYTRFLLKAESYNLTYKEFKELNSLS